jgi:hypothetical protein
MFLYSQIGGDVIADFLTGRINPSGKLPITYPKNQDLSGLPYLHSISDMCTDETKEDTLPHYSNIPCKVQWPFGHGLSYSQFTYSDITLSTEILYHRWHDDGDDIDDDDDDDDDESLSVETATGDDDDSPDDDDDDDDDSDALISATGATAILPL